MVLNLQQSIIYHINKDTILFVEKNNTILRCTIFWSLIKKIMNEYYLIN